MIELIQTHNYGSDCTAPYDIETDCKTVGEFVDEVLQKYTNEWGDFKIEGTYCYYEYKHGKLLDEIPQNERSLQIKEIKAAGGYSNMDYFIKIKAK